MELFHQLAPQTNPIAAASAGLPPWLIKVVGRWSLTVLKDIKKNRPSVLEQVPSSWLACYDFTKCNAFFVGFTPFTSTVDSKNQF